MRDGTSIVHVMAALGLLFPGIACARPAVTLEAGGKVQYAWVVCGRHLVSMSIMNAGEVWDEPEGEVRVWRISDTESPTLERTFELPREGPLGRVWPISESRFFVGVREPGTRWVIRMVAVLDLETSERERSVRATIGRVEGLTVSPCGKLVAWAERDGETEQFLIRVADSGTLEPVAQVRGALFFSSQALRRLRFSPDGKLLAFGGETGHPSLGVMDVEAESLLWYESLKGTGRGPRQLAFSPDGRQLYATGIGGLACYDTLSGDTVWVDRPQFRLFVFPVGRVPHDYQLQALAVSPDGRLVAAASFQAKVFIWDARTGERLGEVRVSDYPIGEALVFDPSGRGLWGGGSLDTEMKYYPIERYYPKDE